MESLMKYESFFSRWFKKKPKVFIDKGEDGPYAFGNYEVNPDLKAYLDDVLGELFDRGFEIKYERGSSHEVDKATTLDILVIHLPSGYGGKKLDFHSSELEDMIYHLESYLSKDWKLILENILVVYSWRETNKLHEYVHSVEEYEMVDDVLQEVAIKFRLP